MELIIRVAMDNAWGQWVRYLLVDGDHIVETGLYCCRSGAAPHSARTREDILAHIAWGG